MNTELFSIRRLTTRKWLFAIVSKHPIESSNNVKFDYGHYLKSFQNRAIPGIFAESLIKIFSIIILIHFRLRFVFLLNLYTKLYLRNTIFKQSGEMMLWISKLSFRNTTFSSYIGIQSFENFLGRLCTPT